jgi:2-polyprenyl-3-methyl-5-hydroxy-6-metoxy-1,4-benzoquinol methylase
VSFADIDTGTKQQSEQNDGFADLYIDMRNKEKRFLSDCKVMFLPDIDENHVHYKEWRIRKQSSQRLIDYLKTKNKPLNILEVGCGNGWLSAKLHTISGAKVTGIDVNEPEIQQAQRVFK